MMGIQRSLFQIVWMWFSSLFCHHLKWWIRFEFKKRTPLATKGYEETPYNTGWALPQRANLYSHRLDLRELPASSAWKSSDLPSVYPRSESPICKPTNQKLCQLLLYMFGAVASAGTCLFCNKGGGIPGCLAKKKTKKNKSSPSNSSNVSGYSAWLGGHQPRPRKRNSLPFGYSLKIPKSLSWV